MKGSVNLYMKPIVPVLLGADLNCYNIARAFHEAYGVRSHAFGRYAVSATKYSRIIDFTTVDRLDDDEVMLDTLISFARKNEGSLLILLGCTDDYTAMVVRHAAKLREYYFAPAPSADAVEELTRKAGFYRLCDKYGIDYPKTCVLNKNYLRSDLEASSLGFGYPVVVKPSSSIQYWKHPFDGMKKVYVAADAGEAAAIMDKIYASGYADEMIVQKFIPGGDDGMRVLTAYSDANGKVRMMCLGHVLLEEHTPHGLGNHAAIITEPDAALCERFRSMLESERYTGFSNFDLKYDPETGICRAFEINLRQGRSNYYVTASGHNIAKLLVADATDGLTGCDINEDTVYWRSIPHRVVMDYVADETLARKADALKKSKKSYSSLIYPYDLRSPMRLLCVAEQLRRQNKKFKTYCKKR